MSLAVLLALTAGAAAEEPFFHANDVVALVGGEEMVAAAEAGELELAVTTALPDLHLVFRSLAWEGDTAYEQRRDLNYPPLDDQLAKMKATVVISQFGQMESFSGKAKLPEFIAAYDKLLDRLASPEHRRLLLIVPHRFTRPAESALPDLAGRNGDINLYADAIEQMARRRGVLAMGLDAQPTDRISRDGIHLNGQGQSFYAFMIASTTIPRVAAATFRNWPIVGSAAEDYLRRLIREKNRLWFNYYRPQNWAFLAGDRVNQPSSHDHLDPSKRWFPGEMEQYVPLIEQKDRQIWEAAAAAQIKPAP